MDIISADHNLRQSWDAYVLAHPEGMAYHLYAWREAVAAGYGFAGHYLMAREGAQVRGVLPLIALRRPLFGTALVSLPYGDVGGILADDPAAASALLASARQLAKQSGARRLELRQVLPVPEPGPDAAAAAKVLMLLELPATAAALLAQFPPKLRSQVRKPQRDGLTCDLGGAELLADFYRVFARNMRDLGSPVHSRQWLSQVVTAFGERARVAVVRLADGRPAAAGLILCGGRTVSVPWASSLREWNHLNPNMLLYWNLLAFAADHGFARFDFGRSTPGSGTWRFKAQWGARPVPLRRRDELAATPPQPVAEPPGLGRRVAASLWAQLPLPASLALGPRLRRYISL